MKQNLINRTFKGKITFGNLRYSIFLYFNGQDRANISISIAECNIKSIPIYFFREVDNRVEFFIWDSPMLGKCTFIEKEGMYFLVFQNVCGIEEKTIALLEEKNHVCEMCCGNIKEYNEYQNCLLKKQYCFDKGNLYYEYIFEHEEYKELRSLFNSRYINMLKNDFEKALYIMRILHKIMISVGDAAFIPKERSGAVLLNARKEKKYQLNCRGCAIVLNDVLLSFGIPSKFIACMSENPYDPECHVTNSVFIKEYNKWILLDAATQSYIEGENGVPLSIFETHNKLLKGERLRFMISPNIPNNNLVRHNFENYLIKNMFCFLSYQKYGPYVDNWNNRNKKYLLLPAGQETLYSKLNFYDSNLHVTNNPIAFFEEVDYAE